MPLAMAMNTVHLLLLLLQSLLIFMQLRHEPKIGFRDPPFRLNKSHSFTRSPAIQRHQKRAYDTRAAADPLHAVYEHPRLRVS